jgi:hypothetical protein
MSSFTEAVAAEALAALKFSWGEAYEYGVGRG